MRVVLASHNAHKLAELRHILEPEVPGIELVGYDGPTPVESGVTFAENALIKARAAREHTGESAIADDSGIALDVLGGSPGVFSARWSGSQDAPDADQRNLELLLAQVADVPDEHRGAMFVCAAALVTADGREIVRLGEWPGTLLRAARGAGGFGYDPIFQPAGESRSAAELLPVEKQSTSHRSRAFRALAADLRETGE